MTHDSRQLRFQAVALGRPVVPPAVSPKVVPAAYRAMAVGCPRKARRCRWRLTDIRLELAREPSVTTLWGMIATTVCITAAMIGVFVDFLTYLQAFHASTVSLSSVTANGAYDQDGVYADLADRHPDATAIVRR
jgi:hypothetical protein